MNLSALRAVALLILVFAGTGANAALLRLYFNGPVAYPSEDWTGPGEPPLSFEVSFTFDTLSASSASFTYIGDESGEIQSYRFYGVDVLAGSLIANGSQLWDDTQPFTFDFGGDYPNVEPEGGFCFCYLGGTSAGQGFGVSYVAGIPPRSKLGDDPLGAILLAQAPINAKGMSVQGEWGSLVGDGFVDVSAVPAPPAIWLLGTGCLGLLGWAKRQQINT